MNAQYDVPMYPQLGHVYPGDYYEALNIISEYVETELTPKAHGSKPRDAER